MGVTTPTPRQMAVARGVRLHLSDKQIAARLGISRQRVREIMGRLAVVWRLDSTLDLRTQIAEYMLQRP